VTLFLCYVDPVNATYHRDLKLDQIESTVCRAQRQYRAAGAAWGIQTSDEADARRTLAREFKEIGKAVSRAAALRGAHVPHLAPPSEDINLK
jgi:hypothetical protein